MRCLQCSGAATRSARSDSGRRSGSLSAKWFPQNVSASRCASPSSSGSEAFQPRRVPDLSSKSWVLGFCAGKRLFSFRDKLLTLLRTEIDPDRRVIALIATWDAPVESVRAADARICILVVDDHRIVADALAALLNQQPDMLVVGNAGSVADSAARGMELSPDVLIVDFRLSDGTGKDAIHAIRAVGCMANVIFLSRDDSERAHYAAVEAGASAFIHKSRATAELIDAVRCACAGRLGSAGHRVFSPAFTRFSGRAGRSSRADPSHLQPCPEPRNRVR